MERLLMKEPRTMLGKVGYYLLFAFFLAVLALLLFAVLQGIPAIGRYLQYELGTVKTGYYFVSVVFFLVPATLIYIMFSED